MRICGKTLPPKAALLLGTNIVLLGLAVPLLVVAQQWGGASQNLLWYEPLTMMIRLIPVGLFCQAVFYYHELYNLQVIRRGREQAWRLLQGAGVAMLILAIVYAVMPHWSPGRRALLAFTPCVIAVVFFTRLLALPGRQARVFVIGPDNRFEEIRKTIEESPEWNMELVQHLGNPHSVPALHELDRVIVSEQVPRTGALLDILTELKMRGVRVETAARFFENATGRVHVDELRRESFVFSSGFENGRQKRLLKRMVDIICASVLLILSLPVMAFAALLIRIEGKGPVLFRQKRVGLYGKVFQIFKFRTMVPAAPGQNPQWTANGDKRITIVGQFLRNFRIDELPQLFNILRGEMSLVGPRPEQPYFCEILAREIPYYNQRHSIPPGLTGWAQVRYGYTASVAESKRKLEFDLFYVKHLSIWLDMAILFETVKVVLVGRGAK